MLQTCNHWIIPKLIISPITYKTATAIYFLTIFLSFTQHNNPTVSNSILNMASVSIFSIPLPCLGQCLLSAPSASPLTPHSFYSFPRSQVIFFTAYTASYHFPASYTLAYFYDRCIKFKFHTFFLQSPKFSAPHYFSFSYILHYPDYHLLG